jgi:hypothetical protein
MVKGFPAHILIASDRLKWDTRSAIRCPCTTNVHTDKSYVIGRWGSTGLLVGAVGIELLNKFTKSHAVTVLPTASQMNWSQMELSWFGKPKAHVR